MAVQQIILDWIDSESSACFFFWLYGPAGAGKTAILQAIAEFLCSLSGSGKNFGGSFFFSRGKKARDQGHFLFSTIAYQLALNVPGLREHVNRIMELNPSLHTKSIDVQLQTLIVDAFKYLSPLPQRSYLVIIDGLDECHDKATQQSILRLLCETITIHKLPLRFLIGSRPESHIRDNFDHESLYTITRRVVLDETFNPGRDIRVFLQDGFAKICAKNPILSHVKQPWPEEGTIDLLVQRSSGQFIYAATILKFVGVDFCSPTKQLALVLKPDSTAFSDLDQLYTQILSVYPSSVDIVQVLGIITASGEDSQGVIEDILGMEEGELKLVLCGLSSLMEDESDKNGEGVIPYFAHASFCDFLLDSSRSGPFHVNLREYENQITTRSFALIIQSIRSWRMFSITRVLRATTWDYFTRRLPYFFCRSPKAVKELIMEDVNYLTQEFWRTSGDGVFRESFFPMRRLLKILHISRNTLVYNFALSEAGDRIGAKFKTLFDGYRKIFDQSFFESKDLGDMLRFLPGVVVQKPISMQGMVDLYRIRPDILERLIESTIMIESSSRESGFFLDYYICDFLQDRDRSQLCYCDPMLQHISICRHILSLLDGSNVFDLRSHDLSDYVYSHFYNHLHEATTVFLSKQSISDDHPVIEILRDLENTAYRVDNNLSCYTLRLARCIVHVILRWAHMMNCHLKSVAVSGSVSNVDLKERLCHLTTKVYREILHIERHERMSYITMGGLDNVQVSAFSCIPQYRTVLSWDLLAWILDRENTIPHSFTNFITTPELSGPLYINPDIYDTQITEYSLESIYMRNYFRLSPFNFYQGSLTPSWSFKEHLSHALPTEVIFYLLRSIRTECLSNGYFRNLILDTLEIIIKWLQGLGSERPCDLYDRFQRELLQIKKPPLFLP